MKLLPNAISFLRISFIPLTIYFYSINQVFFALSFFLTFCLLDIVDGWLARRYKSTSKTGHLLDIVVDFLMVVILSIYFSLNQIITVYLPILLIITFTSYLFTLLLPNKPLKNPIGQYSGTISYLYFFWILSKKASALIFPLTYLLSVYFLIVIIENLVLLIRGRRVWGKSL